MSRRPARDAWIAGTRPKTSATPAETSSAKSSTPPSRRTSCMRGRLPSGSACTSRTPAHATSRPERAADRRRARSFRPAPGARAARVRRRAPRAPRFRRAGSRAAPGSGWRRWRRRSAAGSRPRAEISSSAGRTVVTSCSCAEIDARAPAGVAVGKRRREPAGDRPSSRAAPAPASTPSARRPTTLSDRALRERPCASFGSKLSGVQMSTLRARREIEFRRHHADNGVRLRVELNRPADRAGDAAEMPLPERAAEDRDAVGAGRAFLRQRTCGRASRWRGAR